MSDPLVDQRLILVCNTTKEADPNGSASCVVRRLSQSDDVIGSEEPESQPLVPPEHPLMLREHSLLPR